MKHFLLFLAISTPVCCPVSILWAQDQRTESFLGNLAPIARSIQKERGFPMDYTHRGTLSVTEWRSRGRAEVQNRLAYWPKRVPLDIEVRSVVKRPGYEIRTPEGRGPFPGVVALHDHGGKFFHGKEKLVRMEGEHASIQRFRDDAYGGAFMPRNWRGADSWSSSPTHFTGGNADCSMSRRPRSSRSGSPDSSPRRRTMLPP